MCTKNMKSQENQEQQALEQIRTIIETLGPDSYITSALQNIFSVPSETPGNPNLLDELQKIRLLEKTVQEWDTASQIEELQRQIQETEAHLAVLKEKLHNLTAKQ
ncbi:hypothetical protein D7Y09_17260 [bacterium 1XD42-1]|nr:hypothetical protein D7Y09_17260 [bacterium 1XD42-1]